MRKTKSCLHLAASSNNLQLELEPTALYLGNEKQDGAPAERLYLPRTGTAPCSLDEYLSTIPRVVSRTDELMALCEDDDDDEHVVANEEEEVAAACTGLSSSMLSFSSSSPAQSTSNRALSKSKSSTSSLLQQASSSRCLNVLQGEVAHASSLQADIVVSAEATTCHVVALRSTSTGPPDGPPPLVSMAHVDQADCYDKCLEAMLQQHVNHHHHRSQKQQERQESRNDANEDGTGEDDEYGFFMEDDDDSLEDDNGNTACDNNNNATDDGPHFIPRLQEQQQLLSHSAPVLEQASTNQSRPPTENRNSKTTRQPIQVELHMLGGFLDKDCKSQELSTSLLTTFSRLADKYRDTLRICLSTAAISCLNSETTTTNTTTSSSSAPKSRGLGIDTHTGQVFPVKSSLPSHLEGPAVEVRSARAWHTAGQALSVIHDATSQAGQVRVEPFCYQPAKHLDVLLRVPDPVLLQHTSTSPEHESDQFCTNLRRTLSFVNSVPPEHVFGHDKRQPLVYQRSGSGRPNEWAPVANNNNMSSSL